MVDAQVPRYLVTVNVFYAIVWFTLLAGGVYALIQTSKSEAIRAKTIEYKVDIVSPGHLEVHATTDATTDSTQTVNHDAHGTGKGDNNVQKFTVYLAAPLFTQAEWQWNERLSLELKKHGVDLVLPQAIAGSMLSDIGKFDPNALFKNNIAMIDKADAIVAILDGSDVDSGTAWECGYAFRIAKPVIGLRTDIRAGGDVPKAAVNLMLHQSCSKILAVPPASRSDLSSIAEEIADAVHQAIPRPHGPAK